MAFGGKIKTESTIKLEEENENVGLSCLNPTKDIIKDSFNDMYKEELIKKNAYQYTLKTLNALKIVSPLINALMQKPGIDATNEELSDSFRHLIKEISTASQKSCEKIGVDPEKESNFWIRNVFEKSFSEILGNQWVKQGKTDVDKVIQFLDDTIKFSENVAEKTEFEDLPNFNLIKIGNMKAMMKVISVAKTEFDLFRDIEKDIEPIMEKIFNATSEAVTKIADGYANSSERAKLFYMITQEAGQLYATAWQTEVKRVNEIISSYKEDKLEKLLERYKQNGGLPLDKINHDFDKYFSKMLVVTEKLVSSNKSGIDKKMKKPS